MQDSSIEEFLLDSRYDDLLIDLINRYKENRKNYEKSFAGDFERNLDEFLQYLKFEMMTEYRRVFGEFDGLRLNDRMYDRLYSNILRRVEVLIQERRWIGRERIEDILSIRTNELLHRLRDYLNYGSKYNKKSPVFRYLNNEKSTSMYSVNEFFRWLKGELSADISINQIPDAVLDTYVEHFEEDYFHFHRNISLNEARKMGKRIRYALHNIGNTKYFNELTERYRDRVASYKCVFLSEDDSFYNLVEQNWMQLNEYTANHLDIFYNPDELKPYRGYKVMDALHIRKRVDCVPCIYLWRTTVDRGGAISTTGLSMEKLLQLIKEVVRLIVAGKSLDEIINNGNEYADLLRLQLNKNSAIEERVLKNLVHACVQLQNNPDMYSKANKNQKNTQIRDLMRNLFVNPIRIGDNEYSISIEDQTLNGFSATGKSAGEIDLMVKVQSLPFAIIEGIDIRADKQGKHWVRRTLYEHIVRFGQYDQNGLERNILLVYVKTDDFNGFYQSMLIGISNSPNASIKGSHICELEDLPLPLDVISNFASIKLARGKYTYNDCCRSLYICIVKIAS